MAGLLRKAGYKRPRLQSNPLNLDLDSLDLDVKDADVVAPALAQLVCMNRMDWAEHFWPLDE